MSATGNPILDNPTLKAAMMAQMQPQAPPPAPVTLPPGAAAQVPSIPAATAPTVFSTTGKVTGPGANAPRGTLLGDQTELSRKLTSGSGISQIGRKIESSGFGQKHPVLGKVLGIGAQGLAELGDIGLSSVAPRVAAEIPGTELHHNIQVRHDRGQVAADTANEGKQALTQETLARIPYEQAQTEHLQAETAGLPEEEAQKKALSDAQIQNLLHPQAKDAFQAWRQQNPDAPVEKFLQAQQDVKPQRADMPEQQYIDDYQKRNPGSSIQDAVRAYAKDTQKANQGGMITLIAPDPNNPGGGIVERVGAGAHIAPGAQTAAGFSSMNTPTTTVRTAASRAQMVNDAIPGVLADIEKNKTQMGPLMGRWNDFMQGKVGTDNPDFAALRMDLTLLGTAVALAHAQGRLPENLREEFDHAINAPQQTPENLEAAIKAVQPWMQRMQEAGARPGAPRTQGAPAVGAVQGGYRFKGGDPADQKNWEKVK